MENIFYNKQNNFKMDIFTIKKTFPYSSFDWLEYTEIKKISNILKDIKWRLVGGVVRDSLLGKQTNDIDITIDLSPVKTLELFLKNGIKALPTGIEHGTISVYLKNLHNNEYSSFEITSLRKDVKTFGRKAQVEFGGTWQEDCYRRDFTFNGLMFDYNELFLYDYCEGLKHLQSRSVKFIGSPNKRIEEDYLRIIRYIRFYTRFSERPVSFSMIKILQNQFYGLNIISLERISKEFELILSHDFWKKGITLINTLKLDRFLWQVNLFKFQTLEFLKNEDIPIHLRFAVLFFNEKSKTLKNLKKWPFTKNIKYCINLLIVLKNFNNKYSIKDFFLFITTGKFPKNQNKIDNLLFILYIFSTQWSKFKNHESLTDLIFLMFLFKGKTFLQKSFKKKDYLFVSDNIKNLYQKESRDNFNTMMSLEGSNRSLFMDSLRLYVLINYIQELHKIEKNPQIVSIKILMNKIKNIIKKTKE
jgi:tRNA nucleotidyltransferase/poly(A) polymerase